MKIEKCQVARLRCLHIYEKKYCQNLNSSYNQCNITLKNNENQSKGTNTYYFFPLINNTIQFCKTTKVGLDLLKVLVNKHLIFPFLAYCNIVCLYYLLKKH